MFKKTVFNLIPPLFLMGAMLACGKRLPAIYNTDNIAISQSSEKTLALEEIRAAIVKAASDKGWQANPEKPGLIIATYHRNNIMAQVSITYSKKNYKITYKDSENLRYTDGKIHGTYNRWVRNLSLQIQKDLILFGG